MQVVSRTTYLNAENSVHRAVLRPPLEVRIVCEDLRRTMMVAAVAPIVSRRRSKLEQVWNAWCRWRNRPPSAGPVYSTFPGATSSIASCKVAVYRSSKPNPSDPKINRWPCTHTLQLGVLGLELVHCFAHEVLTKDHAQSRSQLPLQPAQTYCLQTLRL